MWSKTGLSILNLALRPQSIRMRQNTRVLKGTEGLDERIVRIIVALPAKFTRFRHGANGQPGLSNGPVKEVPGTPVKSFELATVLGHYSLPDMLLVLVPFGHEEVVGHALVLSLGCPLSELWNLKEWCQ